MSQPTSAVAFPPGASGVLLPRHDRSCAALGVTLYTASKPIPLAIQWAAWAWVRTLGPRWLPGASETLQLPYLKEIAVGLGLPGDTFTAAALYRRRDSVRSGATFVVSGREAAPMLIKVRGDHDRLAQEQLILSRLESNMSLSFLAPRPLGIGQLSDGRTWAAQEMVFKTPHFPCTRLGDHLLTDLSTALQIALPDAPPDHPDWLPAHRDLTPWNLRRDHRGRTWLFDWEDAGYAPPGADSIYFHAALGLVRPREPMPTASSTAAAQFWIERVEARLAAGHPDEQNTIILNRLRAGARQGG